MASDTAQSRDSERLASFSPVTRRWFLESFDQPTTAQDEAWRSIASGEHTLVVAPTGSGKTLAAFLWSIDQLIGSDDPPPGTSVVYVSPLKALAVDIERNLRGPLAGIRRLDPDSRPVSIGMRTGDTTAAERRRLITRPPDILITTPESLYLMLTSEARNTLRSVRTVIVDEVHAVAGNKRGSHLALSLERLEELADRPQRIGLSATVRPTEVVAGFLGGERPVRVVAPAADKSLDLRIAVPVEDLANPPVVEAGDGATSGPSVWPHVEESIVDAIAQHTATLVFTNSRRLSERLTTRLNEIWSQRLDPDTGGAPQQVGGAAAAHPPAAMMGASGGSAGAPPVLARAHHGSVSKERRREIEDDLKSGRLRAVVATSSLELGIDMGAIDLVIQVQAPPGVNAGLQRVGRAGHQVGAVSSAVLYPTHRGDLLASVVTMNGMAQGRLEAVAPPRHPLDVLAQQIVAAVAMDDWDVDRLFGVVRRAQPYRELPRSAFEAVLDMLTGHYPSEEFANLRARLMWDRAAGTLAARPGAQRIAVTSGGTIPDRGHFGVFLAAGDENRRVGELDEEMVYESRVGDVFALGSTSWRIEDITTDRVLVSPAPGQPARLPFWHGDAIGRPVELGRSLGQFMDDYAGHPERDTLPDSLDPSAAANLRRYLDEQIAATHTLPGVGTIVVEQFTDELGDRRVVIHSPWGARVHAPWALIVADRLQERYGIDAQVMPADDGIVARLPDDGSLESMPSIAELLAIDPADVLPTLTRLVGGSALFASRFRECAARSLLFPRRDPTKRSPLWQQRQRSAQLLGVAARYDSFPVVLETVRECLQDVYDVPALTDLMGDLDAGRIRLTEVVTPAPSPFARSLLFGYVATFLYEGDSPLAERKSAALALDDALLTELLGTADLRELLDAQAIRDVADRLQFLGDRAVTTAEAAWDALRALGPLQESECAVRGITPDRLATLGRRLFRFKHAGSPWVATIEDAGLIRDALGVALPPGIPEAFLAANPGAVDDLVLRFARTHGPFTADQLVARFGLGAAVIGGSLGAMARRGVLLSGAFLPDGATDEWCHPDTLRAVRRASAARYRDELEPVPPQSLARFLAPWQEVAWVTGAAPRLYGRDGLLAAVEQLAGVPLPVSQLDSSVLGSRVRGYEPALLDELTSSGEVVWWGVASLQRDGWVCLAPADAVEAFLPIAAVPDHPIDLEVLAVLGAGGGWFLDQLVRRLNQEQPGLTAGLDDPAGTAPVLASDVEAAVWRLVWAGMVTNDTLNPLRTLARTTTRRRSVSRRSRVRLRSAPAAPRTGRWSALPAVTVPDPAAGLVVAESLLERYGLVTRGAVVAERRVFAEVYRALSALEDKGLCRRGYVVDGLGGAQFGLATAIDRIRDTSATEPSALVLAAADPANPYGAALPWPETGASARPGRKAGASVVLVDGEAVVYVERGGTSLLVWQDQEHHHRAAADAMRHGVNGGRLPALSLKRINGGPVGEHPFSESLEAAGAVATPSGLRLRGSH
jgi:ATP-dependent helicase Lhr and Lhr-like helicase